MLQTLYFQKAAVIRFNPNLLQEYPLNPIIAFANILHNLPVYCPFRPLSSHLSIQPKRLIKLKPICYVPTISKKTSLVVFFIVRYYRWPATGPWPALSRHAEKHLEKSQSAAGGTTKALLATNFNALSGPSWFFVRAHDVIKLLLIVETEDFFGGFSVIQPAAVIRPRLGQVFCGTCLWLRE